MDSKKGEIPMQLINERDYATDLASLNYDTLASESKSMAVTLLTERLKGNAADTRSILAYSQQPDLFDKALEQATYSVYDRGAYFLIRDKFINYLDRHIDTFYNLLNERKIIAKVNKLNLDHDEFINDYSYRLVHESPILRLTDPYILNASLESHDDWVFDAMLKSLEPTFTTPDNKHNLQFPLITPLIDFTRLEYKGIKNYVINKHQHYETDSPLVDLIRNTINANNENSKNFFHDGFYKSEIEEFGVGNLADQFSRLNNHITAKKQLFENFAVAAQIIDAQQYYQSGDHRENRYQLQKKFSHSYYSKEFISGYSDQLIKSNDFDAAEKTIRDYIPSENTLVSDFVRLAKYGISDGGIADIWKEVDKRRKDYIIETIRSTNPSITEIFDRAYRELELRLSDYQNEGIKNTIDGNSISVDFFQTLPTDHLIDLGTPRFSVVLSKGNEHISVHCNHSNNLIASKFRYISSLDQLDSVINDLILSSTVGINYLNKDIASQIVHNHEINEVKDSKVKIKLAIELAKQNGLLPDLEFKITKRSSNVYVHVEMPEHIRSIDSTYIQKTLEQKDFRSYSGYSIAYITLLEQSKAIGRLFGVDCSVHVIPNHRCQDIINDLANASKDTSEIQFYLDKYRDYFANTGHRFDFLTSLALSRTNEVPFDIEEMNQIIASDSDAESLHRVLNLSVSGANSSKDPRIAKELLDLGYRAADKLYTYVKPQVVRKIIEKITAHIPDCNDNIYQESDEVIVIVLDHDWDVRIVLADTDFSSGQLHINSCIELASKDRNEIIPYDWSNIKMAGVDIVVPESITEKISKAIAIVGNPHFVGNRHQLAGWKCPLSSKVKFNKFVPQNLGMGERDKSKIIGDKNILNYFAQSNRYVIPELLNDIELPNLASIESNPKKEIVKQLCELGAFLTDGNFKLFVLTDVHVGDDSQELKLKMILQTHLFAIEALETGYRELDLNVITLDSIDPKQTDNAKHKFEMSTLNKAIDHEFYKQKRKLSGLKNQLEKATTTTEIENITDRISQVERHLRSLRKNIFEVETAFEKSLSRMNPQYFDKFSDQFPDAAKTISDVVSKLKNRAYLNGFNDDDVSYFSTYAGVTSILLDKLNLLVPVSFPEHLNHLSEKVKSLYSQGVEVVYSPELHGMTMVKDTKRDIVHYINLRGDVEQFTVEEHLQVLKDLGIDPKPIKISIESKQTKTMNMS